MRPNRSSRTAEWWNLVRFVWNWKLLRRDLANHLPLEVSVEVTNVCNFKCAFCPQSSPTHFDVVERSYLKEDRAREILTQVRDLGYDKSLLHWTLDGEPFMSKEFADLCTVASEEGFTNQYFASNMALTTTERAHELPSNVRYTLTVDYCADAEIFEVHRGTSGSWESVRENIVGILNDPNLAHVFFEVKDMTSYTVSDPVELEKSMAALQALFPESDRIQYFSKVFHNAAGFLPNTKSSKGYRLCPYPWSSLNIASNGDVVACCRDLQHKSTLGNVLDQPLKEIWNGPRMRKLRRSLIDGKPANENACRDCDLPWDTSKFSLRYQLQVLRHRLQFGR